MDALLIIALFIGIPVVAVGGLIGLLYWIGGRRAVRVLCALLSGLAAWAFFDGMLSEPVIGNQGALSAAGTAGAAILMIVTFLIAVVPSKPTAKTSIEKS